MKKILSIVVIIFVVFLLVEPALTSSALIVVDKANGPVPEPATLLLFGAGVVGLAAIGKRKSQQ